MKALTIVALAAALTGCLGGTRFGAAPEPVQGIWIRADGQSGRNNPALASQFEADRSICKQGNDVNRTCMAQRGYVLVPASQAEEKAAELRARSAASAGVAPAAATVAQ